MLLFYVLNTKMTSPVMIQHVQFCGVIYILVFLLKIENNIFYFSSRKVGNTELSMDAN